MPNKYQDLFVRSYIGEQNTLPRDKGELDESPDVIAYGDSPVENPVKVFSGNYSENVSKAILYDEKNYIYVRARNCYSGGRDGTVIVYVSSKSNLSNPSEWTRLTTETGDNSVPVKVGGEGDVAVTEHPFVWTPTKPSNDNPYSLIAVVVTDDNPNPLNADAPAWIAIQDLVADNGGVGWVEYALPKPPERGLTGSLTTTMTVDNASGDDIIFLVSCKDLPVNAQVAYTAENADPDGNPIILERTVVNTPNLEIPKKVQLRENYNGKVTLELYAEGLKVSNDYLLTFECMKVTGSGMDKKMVSLGGVMMGMLVSR